MVAGVGEFHGVFHLIDEMFEWRCWVPWRGEASGGLHECLWCDLAVGVEEESEEFAQADVCEADVAVFEGAYVDRLNAFEEGDFECLVDVVVFAPFAKAFCMDSDGVGDLSGGGVACREDWLGSRVGRDGEGCGADGCIYGR